MIDISYHINLCLKRIGRRVEIFRRDGTSAEVAAVIQPLLYKNKLYVELQPSEVGTVDDGCCRYIGPAETVFAADDRVRVSGKEYTVQRFEIFFIGEKAQYAWGIIRPCTSPAEEVAEI